MLPVHFPFVILSDDIRESLKVTRYSRLNIQRCILIVLSFSSVEALMLLIDSSLMLTIGTVEVTGKPCCLVRAIILSCWSAWISKRTILGWLPLEDKVTL